MDGRLPSAIGELGTEADAKSAAFLTLLFADGHTTAGDDGIGAFDDLRRRLSMSSRTILMVKSARSSMLARLTVRLRSCSAIRSQPKSCRKSRSHISRALTFLNANNGTAVSKGNSSNPAINLERWSGESRRQGIFVNAEYRYFKSSSSTAFRFSSLFDCPLRLNWDHMLDMVDMTLRTLDEDRTESASEARPRDFGAERNET